MDYTKKDKEILLELQIIENLAVQNTATRLAYVTDRNMSDLFLYIINEQHDMMLIIFELMEQYNFITKEVEQPAEILRIKSIIESQKKQ